MTSFAATIVAWQRQFGRHDLPWQNTGDAYRIWLAEIMLQQTQVATVRPYFLRFIERFPDLRSLAAAPLEAVMQAWAGLGYYSRARNLHRCAQVVMSEYGGTLPRLAATLESLPGIGRSTAAAIAVFSASEREAILDGNVKRVLARHFEIEGFPGRAGVDRELWRIAERELPATDVAGYTQGLMDLGATICTRARPACEQCPVAVSCLARINGRVTELPTPRPKRVRPTRSATLIVVRDERGAFLLQRRPPTGIWGGLASPLEFDPQLDQSSLADEVHRRVGFGVELGEPLEAVRHEFSHYTFVMHPRLARPTIATRASDGAGLVWVAEESIGHAALPAPIRRLLLDVVKTTALVEQR